VEVKQQIKKYIAGIPDPRGTEIQDLHQHIVRAFPKWKLWFFDGKNTEDKTVTNQTIGYGVHTIKYANGTTREVFRIGMGANKTGIFVYILPIRNKTYLAETYGKKLGKATMTGYCIKFKTLKDISIEVLLDAMNYKAEPENQTKS